MFTLKYVFLSVHLAPKIFKLLFPFIALFIYLQKIREPIKIILNLYYNQVNHSLIFNERHINLCVFNQVVSYTKPYFEKSYCMVTLTSQFPPVIFKYIQIRETF